MPGKHSILSPSSAERWTECPASVRMTAKLPPSPESSYAREGTAAHALGELKARLAFKMITKAQFTSGRVRWEKEFPEYAGDEETMVDMELHTDAYVELLKERMTLYPHSTLQLEQRLDTGVPESKGTSDAVIVSPRHVEIIDFKYGAGVAVEAEGNPQLKLYCVGALETYGDILGDTEVVLMTVHQPRMDHILTAEMLPDDLRAWRDGLIPLAELALSDDAPFGPSDAACRWCAASGQCAAQMAAAFPDDLDTDPELLSPEKLSEVLAQLPALKTWTSAVEAVALDQMYSKGVAIPRYKVVMSGGKRAVKNHEEGLKVLAEQGFEVDDIAATKLKGITVLEKLLGKEKFKELLEDSGIVAKGGGSPSVVPESDKRPSITPNAEAAKAFDDLPEEETP